MPCIVKPLPCLEIKREWKAATSISKWHPLGCSCILDKGNTSHYTKSSPVLGTEIHPTEHLLFYFFLTSVTQSNITSVITIEDHMAQQECASLGVTCKSLKQIPGKWCCACLGRKDCLKDYQRKVLNPMVWLYILTLLFYLKHSFFLTYYTDHGTFCLVLDLKDILLDCSLFFEP